MELFKKYWFVLVVVAIVLAAYVAVRKGVINLFDGKTPEQEKAEEEIAALKYSKSNMTISDSDGILIAQQLLSAMDQYGTDEQTIIDLLIDLNRDDLLYVIKMFGIKKYNGAGEAVGLDKWIYAQNLNLAGWIKAELKDSPAYYKKAEAIFLKNNIPF